MKERPMRWASGILLILLLILGIASPALAADSPHNPLMACLFFWFSSGVLAPSVLAASNTIERAWSMSRKSGSRFCRLPLNLRNFKSTALVIIPGLLSALLSPALAADYDLPILRGSSQPPAPVVTVGPATFTRWSGFYFGGDFSYNNGTANFSTATAPLVEFALQNTVVQQTFTPSQLQLLGNGADSAFGGGAFLGYNTQWQDLVLGVEANYTHTNLNTAAATSSSFQIAREFNPPAGNVSSLTLKNAAGQLGLTDYAEARGRAGYVIGNLLPYGFLGVVVGRGSYSISTRVDVFCGGASECVGYPLTPSSGQSNAIFYGYSVGAGLDWAVTPNFFLRGEFDFDQFAPVSNISLSLISGRLGAGLKF
jgi:outer membrane immunogenic protein